MGVARFGNKGGRVGGAPNQLLDAVEADVEAAVQDGGGVVGGESVDVRAGAPAVRAGLLPGLERDGGGGGGGRRLSLDPFGARCLTRLTVGGGCGRLVGGRRGDG